MNAAGYKVKWVKHLEEVFCPCYLFGTENMNFSILHEVKLLQAKAGVCWQINDNLFSPFRNIYDKRVLPHLSI